MREFISILLSVSLVFLGGCITPLTSQQKCALVGDGEVYEGSVIGSQTNIGSIGNVLYSYQTTAYHPRCRMPQTAEERTMVKQIRPEAQKIRDSNITKRMITYTSIILGSIALVIAVIAFKK